MSTFLGCSHWQPANHVVYHVASGIMFCGVLIPDSKHGDLLLHGLMCLGFLLMSTWSWVILCATDYISWNIALLLLHGLQTACLLYRIRPVKFSQDLENVYDSLFRPLRVSRLLYKKLVSPQFCALMTLHDGESYAVQSVTCTDKLGLLVFGVMQAYSHQNLLHSITQNHFIDSPEFESTLTGEEKFQVSIIASGTCRYLIWPRQSLEYLLGREPYLACVMKTLIGRDITNKLYALNEKVATPAGSRLDIRLPSIPNHVRQRKDLRHALVGVMENEVMVTGRDEVMDSEIENDLSKQIDAGAQPFHLLPFTNWSLLLNVSESSVHDNNKVGHDGRLLGDWNDTGSRLPSVTPSILGSESGSCETWQNAQHAMFQLAHLCAVLPLLTPASFRHHVLLLRCLLAFTYFLLVMWAGFVVCMLDVVVWNCLLFFIDMMHIISLAYTNIPNQFSPCVNDFYKKRLRPLKVSPREFGEMCNLGTIVSLHKGGFYSFENHTVSREKISVLLMGRLKVTHEGVFLHSIDSNEFIDSPEFDSLPLFSGDASEKFQVTISASEDSMMLSWVYPILQAYFASNPFMYAIFTNLIGKDICDKLYKMQEMLLKNPEEFHSTFITRNTSMVNVRRCLQSTDLHMSDFSDDGLEVSANISESSLNLINDVQAVNPETKF